MCNYNCANFVFFLKDSSDSLVTFLLNQCLHSKKVRLEVIGRGFDKSDLTNDALCASPALIS